MNPEPLRIAAQAPRGEPHCHLLPSLKSSGAPAPLSSWSGWPRGADWAAPSCADTRPSTVLFLFAGVDTPLHWGRERGGFPGFTCHHHPQLAISLISPLELLLIARNANAICSHCFPWGRPPRPPPEAGSRGRLPRASEQGRSRVRSGVAGSGPHVRSHRGIAPRSEQEARRCSR